MGIVVATTIVGWSLLMIVYGRHFFRQQQFKQNSHFLLWHVSSLCYHYVLECECHKYKLSRTSLNGVVLDPIGPNECVEVLLLAFHPFVWWNVNNNVRA